MVDFGASQGYVVVGGGGGGGVFPAPGAIRPLSAKSWRLKPYGAGLSYSWDFPNFVDFGKSLLIFDDFHGF